MMITARAKQVHGITNTMPFKMFAMSWGSAKTKMARRPQQQTDIVPVISRKTRAKLATNESSSRICSSLCFMLILSKEIPYLRSYPSLSHLSFHGIVVDWKSQVFSCFSLLVNLERRHLWGSLADQVKYQPRHFLFERSILQGQVICHSWLEAKCIEDLVLHL